MTLLYRTVGNVREVQFFKGRHAEDMKIKTEINSHGTGISHAKLLVGVVSRY